MTPQRSRNEAAGARAAMARHEVLASGILSGIAGGTAMLAVAAIGAIGEGIAPLYALEVMGETFVGPEALGGAPKVLFGAVVHLATAAALGILFAAIVPPDFEGSNAVGVGVGFALFTLMVMMSLVVPWANPGFRRAMQAIGGSWVVAHAAYGVALGLAPAVRRWLARTARAAPAPDRERVREKVEPAAPRARTTP